MRTGSLAAMLALLSLLYLVAGCGGDEPAAPTAADVVGLWTATSYQYQSVPPDAAYDVIAYGGAATLDLQQDGDFELTVSPVGELSTTTYGFWELSGSTLGLTPQSLPYAWEFDAALSDGVLSLRGASVEHDFDHDDVPEAATLDMLLVR
ncbi:MAG: hypothetical protein IPM94_08485 [bacterium]|nr:hypothetical protein [bacterium]